MQINAANLTEIYKSLKTIFLEAMQGASPQYRDLAMVVPSSAGVEIYHWLASLPGMREFVGEAQIRNVGANDWAIPNKEWESTLALKRVNIERDQLGVYNPLFASLGLAAAEHPDELIADLLLNGFDNEDYTGKKFFDADKPHNPDNSKAGKFSNKGSVALSAANYATAKAKLKGLKNGEGRPMGLGRRLQLIVSPANEDTAREILTAERNAAGATNIQRGSAELIVLNRLGDSAAWFLQEAGLPIRPLVYQEETPMQLNSITSTDDSYVMLRSEFLYQAYSRGNGGYALPQLIYGSKP